MRKIYFSILTQVELCKLAHLTSKNWLKNNNFQRENEKYLCNFNSDTVLRVHLWIITPTNKRGFKITSTVHSPYSTLHTPHSSLNIQHSISHTQYSTINTLYSTLHTSYSILHIQYSILHTPQFTIHIPHSTLHTPRSILHSHFKFNLLRLRFKMLDYR